MQLEVQLTENVLVMYNVAVVLIYCVSPTGIYAKNNFFPFSNVCKYSLDIRNQQEAFFIEMHTTH